MIDKHFYISDYIPDVILYDKTDTSIKPSGRAYASTEVSELGKTMDSFSGGDFTKKNELVKRVFDFIEKTGIQFDVIVPMLSSRKRIYDPVSEIVNSLNLKVDNDYLKKTPTAEVKNLMFKENRIKELENAFSVVDLRYEGKTILIIDDVYETGATSEVAASIIKEHGNVDKVYLLTIIKVNNR